MSAADRLEGTPVASAIRTDVAERVRRLDARGVTPTLATVLASDDPADERFVALKHDATAAVVDAITPVPGGVGPVTVAMLLSNAVLAAERATDGVEAATGWPP